MRVNVPTNHHYYKGTAFSTDQLKEKFRVKNSKQLNQIEDCLFSSVFELSTDSKTLKQIKIFGFKEQRNKLEEDPQLILKLFSENSFNDKRYYIQTGLFAGVIYHKGYQFNITTPYGESFLRRMLNFVNDIYIDNQDTKATKTKERNEFLNILAYLFIQSLEKAAVLGLPKLYQQQKQRSHKVRGKIDINAYIKNDIPFKGKLTTSFREQIYIQEIIDILFLACKKLEKNFGKDIHRKIQGVYQILKENYSGSYVNKNTIDSAKNHTGLQNPIYNKFKDVLDYAEIILNEENLVIESKNNNQITTYGYLFDISQLFEVYLEKLLNKHFKNWYVTSQEALRVYKGMFYQRYMFPDLVMRNKDTGQVIVFDAKFKTMRFIKNDLDRADFYQIHSYISYYQPNVILGGLLYPLSETFDSMKSYSKNLFGEGIHSTNFIVDGVYVKEGMSMQDIIDSENAFLLRVEDLLNSFE